MHRRQYNYCDPRSPYYSPPFPGGGFTQKGCEDLIVFMPRDYKSLCAFIQSRFLHPSLRNVLFQSPPFVFSHTQFLNPLVYSLLSSFFHPPSSSRLTFFYFSPPSAQLLQIVLQKAPTQLPGRFPLQPPGLPVHPQIHDAQLELSHRGRQKEQGRGRRRRAKRLFLV